MPSSPFDILKHLQYTIAPCTEPTAHIEKQVTKIDKKYNSLFFKSSAIFDRQTQQIEFMGCLSPFQEIRLKTLEWQRNHLISRLTDRYDKQIRIVR